MTHLQLTITQWPLSAWLSVYLPASDIDNHWYNISFFYALLALGSAFSCLCFLHVFAKILF